MKDIELSLKDNHPKVRGFANKTMQRIEKKKQDQDNKKEKPKNAEDPNAPQT